MALVALNPEHYDCGPRAPRAVPFFCFLKNLSGVRVLTTFYFSKNDHRWVKFYLFKSDLRVLQLQLPGPSATPAALQSVCDRIQKLAENGDFEFSKLRLA